MYRVVMVPTDGSEASRQAIPLALAVARPSGATVQLVAVMEAGFAAPIYGVPIASGGFTSGAVADPVLLLEALESERTSQRHALDEFARHLATDAGVAVTATVAEGDVVGTLSRHAKANAADIIVMATHGRGGVGRALLGSVTDALIRAVACPVLVARPHGTFSRESEPAKIAHVLVPLDGSPESDLVVGHAAEVAHVTGARCTLLYVSHPEILRGIAAPDAVLDPAWTQRGEDAAQAHLDQAADLFRTRSIEVSTTVVRSDNPKTAIIQHAGTHAVDLIAMATHARHGLARMMLGSTATSVLHETQLPMLLLNATLLVDQPT